MDRRQALKTLSAPGMPLEMGNTEVYGKTRRIYKNAPKSLRDLFSQTLSNETFLVFEEERYSFNETWALASAIGSGLVKDYGIEKGDRVAICMRNFPEWIIAFQAITSVGAIAVALNYLWSYQLWL
jgi:long-chain acyl-CoA synthetase